MTKKKLSKENAGKGKITRGRSENPFRKLRQEMNRLFDNFWLEPFGHTEQWPETFVPSVDVVEDDNEIRVSAELPGMNEKDIQITLRNGSLLIEGEKKQEEEQKEKNFYNFESSYGSFYRVIDLPAEVDENKADAEFKKGLLKIKLPKTAEAKKKGKKLKIKAT